MLLIFDKETVPDWTAWVVKKNTACHENYVPSLACYLKWTGKSASYFILPPKNWSAQRLLFQFRLSILICKKIKYNYICKDSDQSGVNIAGLLGSYFMYILRKNVSYLKSKCILFYYLRKTKKVMHQSIN